MEQNNGPHDGNTLFEAYIDSVAQEWKTPISVATGNEGAAAHHFTGFVVQGRQTYMEFFTFGDVYKRRVRRIWKNLLDTFRVAHNLACRHRVRRNPPDRAPVPGKTTDGKINITVFFLIKRQLHRITGDLYTV